MAENIDTGDEKVDDGSRLLLLGIEPDYALNVQHRRLCSVLKQGSIPINSRDRMAHGISKQRMRQEERRACHRQVMVLSCLQLSGMLLR